LLILSNTFGSIGCSTLPNTTSLSFTYRGTNHDMMMMRYFAKDQFLITVIVTVKWDDTGVNPLLTFSDFWFEAKPGNYF